MQTNFMDSRAVQSDEKSNSSVKVQYLPFRVEFDGQANVLQSFTSLSKETELSDGENKVLRNQFRGRPLVGSEIKIPDSYTGVVVTDSKPRAQIQHDNDSDKNLNLLTDFNAFTYWNWDQPPSAMDSPRKLMDMLELAQILHTPVEPEDD